MVARAIKGAVMALLPYVGDDLGELWLRRRLSALSSGRQPRAKYSYAYALSHDFALSSLLIPTWPDHALLGVLPVHGGGRAHSCGAWG